VVSNIWVLSSFFTYTYLPAITIDMQQFQSDIDTVEVASASSTNAVTFTNARPFNTSTPAPISSLLSLSSPDKTELHDLFHFIFTTPAETINWRFLLSVEAVFFHHPKAKVIIHSQTIPETGTDFDLFKQANYSLMVQNYSFEDLLQTSTFFNQDKTAIQSFMAVLEDRRKNKFWYSHETDLIRLLLLEQSGGIYLDTDMHLIKPITKKEYTNALGFQGRGNDKVNGAMMIFDKHNEFVQDCLQDAISIASKSYSQRDWEIFGPRLLTRHWNERKNETDIIRAFPMNTLYPYGIYKTKQCFVTPKEEFNPIDEGVTIAVHLNTGITKEYNYTLAGSVCDEMFKKNCIFCDFNHTLDREPERPQ
jgi:hypothetical protein